MSTWREGQQEAPTASGTSRRRSEGEDAKSLQHGTTSSKSVALLDLP